MSTVRNVGSALLANLHRQTSDPVLLRLRPKGMPIFFEDEGMEMGESSLHSEICNILFYGLEFHFAGRTGWKTFTNLNLHYSDNNPSLYVSPDVMLVKTRRSFSAELSSYQIGQEGPVPRLVAEVLSFRTYQQGDLTSKPILYAGLGIPEYILVDVTGELMPRRLLLLRLKADGTWAEEQDADGGITSRLGFRVVLEADGQLRVKDVETGKSYARPREAQEAVDRLHALEQELARLKKKGRKRKGS